MNVDIAKERDDALKKLKTECQKVASMESKLEAVTCAITAATEKNNNVASTNFMLTKQVQQLTESIEEQAVRLVKSRYIINIYILCATNRLCNSSPTLFKAKIPTIYIIFNMSLNRSIRVSATKVYCALI